jgi:SulP family sulfate permease
VTSGEIDWSVFLKAAPEIGAIAGVTVIALMLDITGLEVARMTSANFDHEFRSNGIANLVSAPLGGIMGNLSLNGSRLLDETGGYQRVSGIIASLAAGAVALTNADLPGYVPTPILAGLLMYLGLVVLNDVLLKSPAQKAWTDFGLALIIMIAIVSQGYLTGVVFGFVAACITFAFNYSRVAVVRRHLTRVVYASNMERSASAERTLQEEGDRIHIFWLSGFIFFGSSNRVLESIVSAISETPAGPRRFAVLDFSEVSGFDTSALLSLVKLRNYADEHGITLTFAGLSKRLQAALSYVNLLPPGCQHRMFGSRNEALEWCESKVLEGAAEARTDNAKNDFEDWLAGELGGRDKARRISRYFELRHLTAGTPIYIQGAASDSIDLVIDGTVAVMLVRGPEGSHLVRRMSKRTVVGEMGFFRGLPRVASVITEQGAIIYTLTRSNYERMMAEEPAIGAGFLEFVIRALSDRLEFANSGIAALN